MRSTLSNPVEAGIDSFTKLMGTFNSMEDSKMKRELMAQQEADRKIKMEQETKDNAFKEEQHDYWRKQVGEEAVKKHGTELIAAAAPAVSKMEKKDFDPLKDWDDNDIKSASKLADNLDLTDETMGSFHYIRDTLQKVGESAHGQQVIVPADDALNKHWKKVFGSNQKDIYGNQVDNDISRFVVNGQGPGHPFQIEKEYKYPANKSYNMIPVNNTELHEIPESPAPKERITQGNIDLNKIKLPKTESGIVTLLPTVKKEGDQYVVIPRVSEKGEILNQADAEKEYKQSGKHLGIFNDETAAAQYASQISSSKIFDKAKDYYSKDKQPDMHRMGEGGDPNAPNHTVLGDMMYGQVDMKIRLKEALNKVKAKTDPAGFISEQKTQAENEAIASAFEDANGNFTKFSVAISKIPGMSIKDARGLFDSFAKTQPKLTSKAGKEMNDEAAIIAQYGEDSDQVKEFRKRTESGGKTFKEGDLRHYESGGSTVTEEYKNGNWVKKSASPKWNPKDKSSEAKPMIQSEKDKQKKEIDRKADTDGLGKIARKEVQDKGIDSDTALENAKAKTEKIIGNTKSAPEAVKKLIAAGWDANDAKEHIKYLQSESEPKKAKKK